MDEKKDQSCNVGGCGGPGMCPGIALMIGFGVGTGLTALTGIEWLMPVATVVIGGLLISGIYRRILAKRKSVD
tara:strand:- start:393 stop:611 length:219 start_codon:yes stop_codon:yes gene_type:complete